MRSSLSKLLLILSLILGATSLPSVALASTVRSVQGRHHPRHKARHRERRHEEHHEARHEERVQENRGEL